MSDKYPTYGYHRLTIAIERETGIKLNRKTVHKYRKYLGIKALQSSYQVFTDPELLKEIKLEFANSIEKN